MRDTSPALLIDLDGVLRHWHGRGVQGADERFGLPAGTVSQMAFGTATQELAVLGVLSHRDWCEDVRDQVVARFGAAAGEAVEVWQEDRGTVDQALAEELRRLRERHVVALLSDSTDELPNDIARFGLGDVFDEVLASYERGVVKPCPLAFRTAARDLGREPEEIVFVDDKPANVRAAASVGMRAVRWTDGLDLGGLLRTEAVVIR